MKKLFTLLFFAILGLNNINAATFSSVSSGTWSTPATWNITGADADGKPDADDDVTINAGHTIDLAIQQNSFKTLTIQPSAILKTNSNALTAYGDLTINGSITGTFNYLRFNAPAVFSCSSTFTNYGPWYIYADITISATSVINKLVSIQLYNSSKVFNLGSVTIPAGSIDHGSATSQWVNGVNSTLALYTNPVMPSSSSFDFSASGNTLILNNPVTAIPGTFFYNLTLVGAATRVASGNITIQNNLTLNGNSQNVLNLNNFNLNIGGNLANNANSNMTNQGIITFNGTGTQNMSRATGIENINNLVINGSGIVNLNSQLNVTQSLTINSGTFALNAVATYLLRLQGSLINNSTLSCGTANVAFNGSSAQTISGSSNTQFYDLTLINAAGLTVNSPQSLTNALTISNGNFNANNNFTLISDASKTARIAPRQNASCTFSGIMTIQKHISARAANYHDLSSPVTSTTIMDWDDELFMSGIGSDDGTPGYAGVDGSAGGDSSVYTYYEPTAAWKTVSGSTTTLTPGKGYEIFIADDLTSFPGRTIDTKGTPNFGNKTVTLSYSAGAGAYKGVNLIGNPFASPINYAGCSKTSVTGNILILDNSGNYTDYGANPLIPAHQGFWITASGAGASITFGETAKSTSTATNFYRTAPNYGIKLVFSTPVLPYYNENTINFESNSTTEYDQDLDALYIKSPNKTAPAIYMLTNTDAKLITNNVSSQEDELTIPLAIYTPKEGVYYIEPTVINTNSYNYSWIENTKTGKKHELTSSITIIGEENNTNTNYVLKLSKKSSESDINQSVFDNDIIVFGTENNINLKSINTTHYISQVAVYDISGKLLIEQTNLTVESGQTNKIDISTLSNGVYIVNVIDVLGHVKTQKIIR